MKLYYTCPPDEVFNEVKNSAIKLWSTIATNSDYATEKINCIKDLNNIGDNFMYMVAMFDLNNQSSLANLLTNGARIAIRGRMLDSGYTPEIIPF